MSARVGVAFDHTPLDPIVLADHDGVPRTFEIRSMLVATVSKPVRNWAKRAARVGPR
jgi:hypothetical protein